MTFLVLVFVMQFLCFWLLVVVIARLNRTDMHVQRQSKPAASEWEPALAVDKLHRLRAAVKGVQCLLNGDGYDITRARQAVYCYVEDLRSDVPSHARSAEKSFDSAVSRFLDAQRARRCAQPRDVVTDPTPRDVPDPVLLNLMHFVTDPRVLSALKCYQGTVNGGAVSEAEAKQALLGQLCLMDLDGCH